MFIREGAGAGEERGADEFIARSLGMLAGGLVHWDLGGGVDWSYLCFGSG